MVCGNGQMLNKEQPNPVKSEHPYDRYVREFAQWAEKHPKEAERLASMLHPDVRFLHTSNPEDLLL